MDQQNHKDLTRLGKALYFIEHNIDQDVSVESIAEQGNWSRWQFQRVFKGVTGQSVAQYVRGLRLSLAAERLLDTSERQLDIALQCGFTSEMSFNRAFRQRFMCTPGTYRKRGMRLGISMPLKLPLKLTLNRIPQVRVETRPAFTVYGVKGFINGLFSGDPDIASSVPRIWMHLKSVLQAPLTNFEHIGVIDTRQLDQDEKRLPYWAGLMEQDPFPPQRFDALEIPRQQYAVIPHFGDVKKLPETLQWFFYDWLVGSGYEIGEGFDLEIYGADYRLDDPNAEMEYWIPVIS